MSASRPRKARAAGWPGERSPGVKARRLQVGVRQVTAINEVQAAMFVGDVGIAHKVLGLVGIQHHNGGGRRGRRSHVTDP